MKHSSKSAGLLLLLIAVLTFGWGFLCPKYHPAQGSYLTTYGGKATFDRPRLYYKMDLGVFLAGEIVIWCVVWGGFLVARPGDGERESNRSEE